MLTAAVGVVSGVCGALDGGDLALDGASIGGEGGFIPIDGDVTSVLAPLPNFSLSGECSVIDHMEVW